MLLPTISCSPNMFFKRPKIDNFNTLFHFMTNCKIIQLNNHNLLFYYQILLYKLNQDFYYLKYLYPLYHVLQIFADYDVKFPPLHIFNNSQSAMKAANKIRHILITENMPFNFYSRFSKCSIPISKNNSHKRNVCSLLFKWKWSF